VRTPSRVKRHRTGAYVWAMVLYWLAGCLLAGILNKPTAYQGDSYLLPSVAAVVLGGTSLLGGRGFPIATALAALFLSQLDSFVLALGVSFAARTLVEAFALAIGVALYTVDWKGIRERLFGGRRSVAAST
jgi:ribose transport system permease protein